MAELSDDERREQIRRARHELELTQSALGDAVRTSTRSISRMEGPHGVPADYDFHKIATLMFRHNPARAAELAAFGHSTLEALGLVKAVGVAPPPPEPAPTPLPTLAKVHLVDSVVCAAADAANTTPRAMRPALLAALIRMQEVGLSPTELQSCLETPPTP
jgi:hypothetical protein